jgi:hypothetical protein
MHADFIKKHFLGGAFMVKIMKICLPFLWLLAIISIYVNTVEIREWR